MNGSVHQMDFLELMVSCSLVLTALIFARFLHFLQSHVQAFGLKQKLDFRHGRQCQIIGSEAHGDSDAKNSRTAGTKEHSCARMSFNDC